MQASSSFVADSTSKLPAIPDLESLLLLEAPFARTPYEDLRRKLRTHQRITEREFLSINAIVKDLAKSGISQAELLEKISAIIERVKGLREKLTPVADGFQTSADALLARTNHFRKLHDLETVAYTSLGTSREAAQSSYADWSETRLQRMMVDWLLRREYIQAAQKLAESKKLEAFTDVPIFTELLAIKTSLVGPYKEGAGPKCKSALEWCQDNKAALRRSKSTLEFDIRIQEFIDLCRDRSPTSLSSAITYARRHLLPAYKAALAATRKDVQSSSTPADPNETAANAVADVEAESASNQRIVSIVERVMGLLAVRPGGWAYEDLYSPARYAKLYDDLLSNALTIYSLPHQPTLHVALSAGLSSLKVPACYKGARAAPATPATGANATASHSASSTDPQATAGVGEVDEALLSDVRREIRAEHAKHEAESHPPTASGSSSMDEMHNPNCPVCATVRFSTQPASTSASSTAGLGLGVLAREVPWSHHSNSAIVCRLSGKLIEDEEETGGAVALPNGRVYSKRALEEASQAAAVTDPRARGSDADASDTWQKEFVTCPRTKMRFHRSSMRRVFIS